MIEIQKAVFEKISSEIGKREPECGGVLGARPGEAISKFYFDHSGISTSDFYTPDYETINSVLEEWAKDGVQMVGMIHSHGNEGDFPSCGDLYYCEQILRSNPSLSEFFLPIVTLKPFAIHMYQVSFDEKLKVSKTNYQIL